MKRLAILAVLLVCAVALAYHQRAAAANEQRLGAIASELAQRDVRVDCQSVAGAAIDIGVEAGSVAFSADGVPGDVAELKRPICKALDRFRDDGRASFEAVQAIHTLAHESWHLAGVQGEAQTECYALQTTAFVAERLGADPVVAQGIAVDALRRVYPALPERYRTADCHDGGPLDLRPASTIWP